MTAFRHRWFLIAALLAGATATAGVEAVDDAGRTVRLDAPAERIVSLAPHVTEILFATGAGDRLVGAVAHSDHPPAAKAVPRVGGYSRPDLERIADLEPDLVIAWRTGNPEDRIEKLVDMGLTVYISNPKRLEDVARQLERLGKLAGHTGEGAAAADRFRERLAELRARYADRPPVSVMYQIWHQPVMTVNGEHLISDVIRLCGGRNAFGELPSLVPRISREAVLDRGPQVIVASGMGESRPDWLDAWKDWSGLPAAAADQLHFVPPDLIQRHSPRILDGAGILCRRLEEARAAHRIGED